MKSLNQKLSRVAAFVLLGVALLCASAGAQVNCDTGGITALQNAINAATPGSTVTVSGTCNGNLFVRNDSLRIVIDGGGGANGVGGAMINGANNAATFRVNGKGIVIQGFIITGGIYGINIARGSNGTIRNSEIRNAVSDGVRIDQLAFGAILNSHIHTNGGNGIHVSENSNARIGFQLEQDTTPSSNIIQNNAGRGILLSRNASARIVGNTISGNAGDGIQVGRLSYAELAKNTINGNAANGVLVTQNSGLNLPDAFPSTNMFEDSNLTTANNILNGIRCTLGAYAAGHLGNTNPLNGSAGQVNISDATCLNSVNNLLMTP